MDAVNNDIVFKAPPTTLVPGDLVGEAMVRYRL